MQLDTAGPAKKKERKKQRATENGLSGHATLPRSRQQDRLSGPNVLQQEDLDRGVSPSHLSSPCMYSVRSQCKWSWWYGHESRTWIHKHNIFASIAMSGCVRGPTLAASNLLPVIVRKISQDRQKCDLAASLILRCDYRYFSHWWTFPLQTHYTIGHNPSLQFRGTRETDPPTVLVCCRHFKILTSTDEGPSHHLNKMG